MEVLSSTSILIKSAIEILQYIYEAFSWYGIRNQLTKFVFPYC